MDLKVPIKITDELSDEVILSTGLLNLASGEIHKVEYQDHDPQTDGWPYLSDDYEFSSGTLSNAGKEVEFRVDINKTTGQYSVSASELLEIKVRAAALFVGADPQALLARSASTSPSTPAAPAASRPSRGGRSNRFH